MQNYFNLMSLEEVLLHLQKQGVIEFKAESLEDINKALDVHSITTDCKVLNNYPSDPGEALEHQE